MTDPFTEAINKNQLSNSQFYDKAILTLSSTGLVFSLAIVDINDSYQHQYLYILYIGWAFFMLTILTSLASFKIGNKDLQRAYDNYKNPSDMKDSPYTKINHILNWITALALLVAVVLTVIFVGINIK